MKNKGIGGHRRAIGDTQIWLTPPEIITALGEFDLDPCSPINRPWDTAKNHYNIIDDGLSKEWFGRVWHNPPYDRTVISKWLEKMANHANGITLMFARTETDYFQRFVFPYAESILFLKGRLTFHDQFGIKASANGGAPSVLISYSEYDSMMIERSGIEGHHIPVNYIPVVMVKDSPSWKNVVAICLVRLNKEAKLSDIYEMAKVVAPDKTSKNKHFKEKIRQQLQKHQLRTGIGQYKLFN